MRKSYLPNPWQFELAAMLSQIGCVTVPAPILDKVYANEPLAEDETAMFLAHPSVGGGLLSKIPRLGMISRMIEKQQHSMETYLVPREVVLAHEIVELGAQLLKLALDFDHLTQNGLSTKDAILTLREQTNNYNPHLFPALIHTTELEDAFRVQKLRVAELRIGMIVEEDVWSGNDQLLINKGQELTDLLLVRLRNFAKQVGVKEPIQVRNSTETIPKK